MGIERVRRMSSPIVGSPIRDGRGWDGEGVHRYLEVIVSHHFHLDRKDFIMNS